MPDKVPCAGALTTVKVRLSPSASEPDSVTAVAVSSSVLMLCAFATGGWFPLGLKASENGAISMLLTTSKPNSPFVVGWPVASMPLVTSAILP